MEKENKKAVLDTIAKMRLAGISDEKIIHILVDIMVDNIENYSKVSAMAIKGQAAVAVLNKCLHENRKVIEHQKEVIASIVKPGVN